MIRMPGEETMKRWLLVCAAALLWPTFALAEVETIKIPRGAGGVGFLPLLVMEQKGLIEQKARELGVANLKVEWLKLGGPALVNDLLLSGTADIVVAGPPAFLTLWDRTRENMKVKGIAADDLDPDVSQHALAAPEVDPRFRPQRQDRRHRRQGVDPGDHPADGGDQGVRPLGICRARQVHGLAHAIPTR